MIAAQGEMLVPAQENTVEQESTDAQEDHSMANMGQDVALAWQEADKVFLQGGMMAAEENMPLYEESSVVTLEQNAATVRQEMVSQDENAVQENTAALRENGVVTLEQHDVATGGQDVEMVSRNEGTLTAQGDGNDFTQGEGSSLAQDAQKLLGQADGRKPIEGENNVILQGSSKVSSEEEGEITPEEEAMVVFPEDLNFVIKEEEDSGLVIQRAMAPQITKHFENNSQMFAAPLSATEYMDLQRRLSETEASSQKTAYWVIFHRDNPETIISSCTTYLRDAVINQGQGMQPATAVVITDIFTRPEHRRTGMATMLLRAVQGTLDHGVHKRIDFSIIYSDRNPDFYDRLGWKQQPAADLRILLGKNTVEMPVETPELRYATFPRLAQFTKQDVNTAKCRLSAKREKGKVYAQILPAQKLTRWHAARSLMMKSYLLRRGDKEGGWLGAIFENDQTGAEVVAWWTADLRSRRLYIGRLAATRLKGMESEIKTVLKVAAAEATSLGIREMVLWEPTEQVVKGASLLVEELGRGARVVVEERSDMVPCLRWNEGEEREGGLVDAQYFGWN